MSLTSVSHGAPAAGEAQLVAPRNNPLVACHGHPAARSSHPCHRQAATSAATSSSCRPVRPGAPAAGCRRSCCASSTCCRAPSFSNWPCRSPPLSSSGLAFGVLYGRLRANGWFRVGAAFMLVALLLHAGGLYTLTASSRAIPLYLAFGVLIPAIRSLEDVGDVQSAIGLGLLMPLLLLASPITALLILPFALGTALADPDGRRDPRAFVAMLLVAVLPSLIVALGIVGFIIQARMDISAAVFPYVNTYAALHFDTAAAVDRPRSTGPVCSGAACAGAPTASRPNLPERRHSSSAPSRWSRCRSTWVFARAILLDHDDPDRAPLALLVAFVSWLAVVRLPFQLRLLALALLALSSVARLELSAALG